MKALVFDSSSIITLALNNLLYILRPLKEKFNGQFFITQDVKRELVDAPLETKRFKLEALMISQLIQEGILEISKIDTKQKAVETENIANSIYSANGEKINILHSGESSCIALARILQEEYDAGVVIDERTARMLAESPGNLRKLLEKKLHRKIKMNEENLEYFADLKIIRSSELCYVAYKKKMIVLPADFEDAIEALFYAVKFKGCAISFSEIDKAKKLKI